MKVDPASASTTRKVTNGASGAATTGSSAVCNLLKLQEINGVSIAVTARKTFKQFLSLWIRR